MTPHPLRTIRARLRRFVSPPPASDASLVGAAPTVQLRRLATLFWPDLRPYRRQLLIGLCFLAVVPALETVEILLFQLVVDDVLLPQDLSALLPVALAYLGLAIAGAVAGFGDEYLATWVGERFLLRVRTRVYAHVQRLSPQQLDRRRHGDVLARLTGDVQAIESFILSGIGEGLSAVLRILFFGGALLLLDPMLALASLVVVPAFFLVARTFARLIRETAREKRRRSGSLSAVAEEGLGTLSLVQSLGGERADLDRFAEQGERIVQAELAATRVRSLFAPITDLIRLGGVLMVLALGVWTMQRGGLTVGQLLVFVTLLSQMYGPIRDLGSLSTTIFQAAAAAERVVELLDLEPAVTERAGARTLPRARGHLELRDVTYHHEGSDRPALDGVSLTVRPGETLAITGPSGAGKSTLAGLLMRFADPDHGSVLLDGHDLRDLTIASARDAVGLLGQDAPVPDLPIREVIAAGRPDASDAAIEAAITQAGARDVIDALPEGLDTPAGQRGRRLSGGQRQRIALARTLLRDAPILLLDEPTTGLDDRAVEALLQPLRAATSSRTTVLISHDPRVLACADRVLHLRDGRVEPAPAPSSSEPRAPKNGRATHESQKTTPGTQATSGVQTPSGATA